MAAFSDYAQSVDLEDRELEQYTEFACRLADAAGAQILPHFRAPLAVDNKGSAGAYDPVTEADRGAESAMRELIHRAFPQHGIFGEEHGYERGESALTWVIDPLDGTRSFITGALHWGTLIALYDGMRPVIGVMDQPYTRERFIGNRLGAELRTRGAHRALSTRRCERLEDAVLYTTHPGMFATSEEGAAFERLARHVKLVRYGGDCYSYCMLALGCVDLVVESSLAPYDVQALIPIIEAAGGFMTTWDGGTANFGGQIIAAGDSRLHALATAVLI
ncbi:MAG: histidinol-phosphatase [Chromatiales bacterium]